MIKGAKWKKIDDHWELWIPSILQDETIVLMRSRAATVWRTAKVFSIQWRDGAKVVNYAEWTNTREMKRFVEAQYLLMKGYWYAANRTRRNRCRQTQAAVVAPNRASDALARQACTVLQTS